MSTWLIVVVGGLIAVYAVLRSFMKSTPRREGPTADDREAVVAFERVAARKGAVLIDGARVRLQEELDRYGVGGQQGEAARSEALAGLRGAAADLLACWPNDALEPGEAFAFLRASATCRHPVLRLVLDEGGYEALDRLAHADAPDALRVVVESSRAWRERLAAAHRRLSASQESVWSSLTLLGMSMMGLEPDSNAEQAVSAHVRRMLREQQMSSEVETAVAASLWMLSTTPSDRRRMRAGVERLPLEDDELGETAARMLAQQASQGTADQRARAIAAGRWELLWLAHVVVSAAADNEKAKEAFDALIEPATLAMSARAENAARALEALKALADNHVAAEHADRIVEVARRLAGGESQEQVVGGAPGFERKATVETAWG